MLLKSLPGGSTAAESEERAGGEGADRVDTSDGAQEKHGGGPYRVPAVSN